MGVKTQEEYITGAQKACKVTTQKVRLETTIQLIHNISGQDPCWRENRMSMKCLDDSNYNKSLCQVEFENYNKCKAFWNTISWARRRAGKYPLIPETDEERAKYKQIYRETGTIPTEV